MAIRIIVKESDEGAAANVGGPVIESFRTFDVDAPALEAYLAAAQDGGSLQSWRKRRVIGAEILAATPE